MSRPAAILSPGTRIGGKFEIVEVIGFGGMGVVYKVREQVGAVSRIRALKTVLPQHAEDANIINRFREEAEKMCLLEHENIVPVLSYSEEGQFPYLVMPFIEGRTLKEYLASYVVEHGRGLPLDEIMEIGLEVARGLEVAHNFIDPQTGRPAPMIHRDIKPGNIMIRVEELGDERRLKILIMDFGIAKVVSEEDSGQSLTGVIGTVRYASPEQVRRAKDVDPRADIYSLGMVLYELCTGRHMFADMTEYSVLLRMMQKDVEPPDAQYPEGTPASFRELVHRAVAPDRESRFANVAEMRLSMRRILEEDSGRLAAEVKRAGDAAAKSRETAVARDAPALAKLAFEDAESLLRRAHEAEEASLGIRLFRAAALAFEQAAEQAAREQSRARVAEGIASLDPLKAAARDADASRFAARTLEAAERATREAEAALAGGDVTVSARRLAEAEQLWRDAGDEAVRAARRSESENALAGLRERVRTESSGFDDLPTLFCPPDGLQQIAKARAALDAAAAAAEKGDFSRATSEAAASDVALAEAARVRAGAVEALEREIAGAGRRATERLGALEAGEAATLVPEAIAEARKLRNAAASAVPARAIEAWKAAETAIERAERAAREAVAEREAKRREAERLAREAEARAGAARDGAAKARAGAPETSRREAVRTALDAAARTAKAAEEAFAKKAWDDAAEAWRRAGESWRKAADLEREGLAGEVRVLRERAESLLASLEPLGPEAADPATERFRTSVSKSAGDRDLARAVAALEPLVPEIEAHVRATRERVERERAKRRGTEARDRARAALEGAERFGTHATRDEAFAVARRRLRDGEGHLEAGELETAERELAGAALAFGEITRRAETAARAERVRELRRRHDAAAAALAADAAGWKLRRRRKRGLADLARAKAAIEAGNETGAATALEAAEAAARELDAASAIAATVVVPGPDEATVVTPRPGEAPAAPRRGLAPLALGGLGAAAVGAAALVWWSTQPDVGPRDDDIAKIPPTAAPTSLPTAAPTKAVEPTAPPVEPTGAPPPTVVPPPTAVPPRATVAAATPVPPPPAPIQLARADPRPGRVEIARRSERRFDVAVEGASADALVWKLDGREAGRGRRFTFGGDRSARPGRHTLELVARRGNEAKTFGPWDVVVEAEPVRFRALEPKEESLEREVGADVRFRAPVALAGGDAVTYSWTVNGERARGADGSDYRFAATDPGAYQIRVRAVAPWGASEEKSWRVVVRRAPEPTPPPVDPRQELVAWVQTWCRAYERRDTDTLIAVGQLDGPRDAARLREALEGMRGLEVRCSTPQVDVRGDRATVAFDRTDRWLDPRTGQAVERAHPRVEKTLVRRDGRWVISP